MAFDHSAVFKRLQVGHIVPDVLARAYCKNTKDMRSLSTRNFMYITKTFTQKKTKTILYNIVLALTDQSFLAEKCFDSNTLRMQNVTDVLGRTSILQTGKTGFKKSDMVSWREKNRSHW